MNPVVEELAEALKKGGHIPPETVDLLAQLSEFLGAELGDRLGQHISASESRMADRMTQIETELHQALDNVSTETAEKVDASLDGFQCPMMREGA